MADHSGVPAEHTNAAGMDPALGQDFANTHPRLIDRKMQATLGRHLRVMFDDVARAPVPDHFLDLLQNLETKEKEQHG